MTTDQIITAAHGLYALRLAQDGQVPGGERLYFDELSDFTRGKYFAKAQRMLYDLEEIAWRGCLDEEHAKQL